MQHRSGKLASGSSRGRLPSNRFVRVCAVLFTAIVPILSLAWAQTTASYLHKSGTTWVYNKTITPSDPSSFRAATFRGEQDATLFDRDANGGQGGFVTVLSYIYTLQYDDAVSAEMRVRKSDFPRSRADELARRYGYMMGQLPAILRQGVEKINILRSDALFGGNASIKAIEITIGKSSEEYERAGNIEETLLHEATHAALDGNYGPGWSEAQRADKWFVSQYARDFPAREDIAESFLVFIALAQQDSRLSEAQAADAANAIPNRLRFFAGLRPNLYPLRARAERAVEPRQPIVSLFNTSGYYRLSPVHLGGAQSLDVINNATRRDLMLAPSGNYSGQNWNIAPLPNGLYRLTTEWTGSEVSLETSGAADKAVRLGQTANVSRQMWKIEPVGDGVYRLTIQHQGRTQSLGVVLSNGRHRPMIVDFANVTTQYWRITRVR